MWKKFCSDYTDTVERLRRLLNATEQQHGGVHRLRRVEIAHVYEILQLCHIEFTSCVLNRIVCST